MNRSSFIAASLCFAAFVLPAGAAHAQAKPAPVKTSTVAAGLTAQELELARYLEVLEDLDLLENWDFLELLNVLEDEDDR